jgi:transforming growth factor-beta-induced protein
VFAPTDVAFAELLEDLGATPAELLAREDLADILTYHVVSGGCWRRTCWR